MAKLGALMGEFDEVTGRFTVRTQSALAIAMPNRANKLIAPHHRSATGTIS